jgi:hypothetical protein
MPFESMVWSVAFWVFGLTLGLGLRLLIFQASWALSGLEDPPFSRVLSLVTPLWGVSFITGVLLDGYVFKPLGGPGFGLPRIGGLVVITILASLLDFGVVLGVLRPGVGKGLLIALFEVVLTLLAATLVAGLIFVIVATTQLLGGTHVEATPPVSSPLVCTLSVGSA